AGGQSRSGWQALGARRDQADDDLARQAVRPGDPADLAEGAPAASTLGGGHGPRSVLELDLDVAAVARRRRPHHGADRVGDPPPLADDPAHVGRPDADGAPGQRAALLHVDAHRLAVVDQRYYVHPD